LPEAGVIGVIGVSDRWQRRQMWGERRRRDNDPGDYRPDMTICDQ
jgi:hypothetical protein